MNITKNRKMYLALDGRSESCNDRFYLFFFLLLCVATVLPVAYIFILGTLESTCMMDEISYKFQGLSSTDCNFQGLLRP